MDGTNAAFLLDTPLFSPKASRPRNGILYVEDFDSPPPEAPAPPAAQPPPQPTQADVQAAFAAGHEAGMQAALAEEHLIQTQLGTAAQQALADRLAEARHIVDQRANAHASALSRAVLAILQAALPATMRAHAETEIEAMIVALAPGLRSEPELRVRANPQMADMVRNTLLTHLPPDGFALVVCPDPAFAPPDIEIAWEQGRARRNAAAIYAEIATALAHLNLPSAQEHAHGE